MCRHVQRDPDGRLQVLAPHLEEHDISTTDARLTVDLIVGRRQGSRLLRGANARDRSWTTSLRAWSAMWWGP